MASPITDAMLCPSRRVFLAGAGAFVAWASLPRASYAAQGRDPRFVAVILRGAMDGLAVVPPVGDPDFPALRGDLAIGTGSYGDTLPLDGFFALNASMPLLHQHYKNGDALLVHAVATGYRDRSHFDGQDVLESGETGPRMSKTGWLNRWKIGAGLGVPLGTAVAALVLLPLGTQMYTATSRHADGVPPRGDLTVASLDAPKTEAALPQSNGLATSDDAKLKDAPVAPLTTAEVPA